MLKLEYFAEVRLKIASRNKMVEGEDSLLRVEDETKETVPSSAGLTDECSSDCDDPNMINLSYYKQALIFYRVSMCL